jgi:transcriptional regulator with XRE-family HTH domain
MTALNDRRKRLGLSQAQLAEALGVSTRTIIRAEQSDKLKPSLLALLDRLETSASPAIATRPAWRPGSGYDLIRPPAKWLMRKGEVARRAAHPDFWMRLIGLAPVRPGLPWFEYMRREKNPFWPHREMPGLPLSQSGGQDLPWQWFRYEIGPDGKPQLLDIRMGGNFEDAYVRGVDKSDLPYQPCEIIKRDDYRKPLTDEEYQADWEKRHGVKWEW